MELDETISLDTILCNPEYAKRFDDFAWRFNDRLSSLDYRWMALRVRKRNRTMPQDENQEQLQVLPGMEDAIVFSTTYSIQLAQNFYYVKDTPDYNRQRNVHLEVSNGDIVPSWIPLLPQIRGQFDILAIGQDVYESKYPTTMLNFHQNE